MQQPLTYLRADGVKAEVPAQLRAELAAGPVCSIVVPCYNYGAYLEEAVNSAFAQTIAPVEVIVVDDGSTDAHSRDVAYSLIGRPDVRVVFTSNQGVGAARNTGIRVARGKYICCLDADDVLAQSFVEQCVYVLEAHRNVGFAYPWLQAFGRSGKIWETRDFSIDVAMQQNLTPAGAVYAKSDWALAGGYDETFDEGFEDWEFWMRMGQLGRTGKVIETVLYHRRRHETSLNDTAMQKRERLIAGIRNRNGRLFSDPARVEAILAAAREEDPYRFPSELAAVCAVTARPSRPRLLHVDVATAPGGTDMAASTGWRELSEAFDVIRLTTAAAAYGAQEQAAETFHVPERGLSGGVGAFACYLVATRKVGAVVLAGDPRGEVAAALHEMHPDISLVDVMRSAAAPGAAAVLQTLHRAVSAP